MAGRPASFESQMAELACELQALTHEGIRNELERLRVMKQLARLAEAARPSGTAVAIG